MTDQRSFKPVTASFEETWPEYFGAGFVRLAITIAEWRVRARRGAATADELLLALGVGPWRAPIAAHEFRVDCVKRAADVLCEGEGRLPAALLLGGGQVVIEDAADAAHLLTVRQVEIFVTPGLEALVVGNLMRGASRLHCVMESDRVGILLRAPALEHGGQVRSTAEPPLRGDDHPCIHVHRRHMRVVEMG